MKEFEALMASLRQKDYKQVYCVDGDELFYIEQVVSYIEDNVLAETEKDFNLTVLYGNEVSWGDVINACRRYPMFAERQVVILKNAAQLDGLAELLPYVENPMPTTLLLLDHRHKKLDGKTKLYKAIQKTGVYFNSPKLKEDQVPGWIRSLGHKTGFSISPEAAEKVALYLGNDLQHIANELEKIRINEPQAKELTDALIQKFIGISHEFSTFELGAVIVENKLDRLQLMLNYFMANPKAAPGPLVAGGLYFYFNKCYVALQLRGMSEADMKAAGYSAWQFKDIFGAINRYPPQAWEQALLITADYSARSVGVGSNESDTALLKETVGKLLFNFHGSR